jgi:hypothetical protein
MPPNPCIDADTFHFRRDEPEPKKSIDGTVAKTLFLMPTSLHVSP